VIAARVRGVLAAWATVALAALALGGPPSGGLVPAPVVAADAPDGPWRPELERPRGPYRGRVVDADSGRPIAGAVVVAHWAREAVYPLQVMIVSHAVRETVTRADGTWVLEADVIEREAATRRLRRPSFVIFAPGYGAFPWRQASPTGVLDGLFEGAGSTVALRPLHDRRERERQAAWLSPFDWTDAPFRDLPEYTRLVNEELRQLGLPILEP